MVESSSEQMEASSRHLDSKTSLTAVNFLKGCAHSAGKVFLLLIINVLLFCSLEGMCSLIFVAEKMTKPVDLRLPNLRRHARYDELLGWSSKPNIFFPDIYGKGKNLSTNAQGFRNLEFFPKKVPVGKTRIVCLGDSFAMGYGVDDKDTFSYRLAASNNHLEVVNMGQLGYGVDQAYLWYLRDGTRLDHQWLVLSFITSDFFRMRRENYREHGRPVIRYDGKNLKVYNTPVPKRFYRAFYLEKQLQKLEQLRLFIVLRQIITKFFPFDSHKYLIDDWGLRRVLLGIFRDLRRVCEKKHSSLVLVYLPTSGDYSKPESDPWRKWLEELAPREHMIYLDLVKEFRELPRSEWDSFFGPHNHFSEKGNRIIAEKLYGYLGLAKA